MDNLFTGPLPAGCDVEYVAGSAVFLKKRRLLLHIFVDRVEL